MTATSYFGDLSRGRPYMPMRRLMLPDRTVDSVETPRRARCRPAQAIYLSFMDTPRALRLVLSAWGPNSRGLDKKRRPGQHCTCEENGGEPRALCFRHPSEIKRTSAGGSHWLETDADISDDRRVVAAGGRVVGLWRAFGGLWKAFCGPAPDSRVGFPTPNFHELVCEGGGASGARL